VNTLFILCSLVSCSIRILSFSSLLSSSNCSLSINADVTFSLIVLAFNCSASKIFCIQLLGLKRFGVNASNNLLPNAQKETLSPRKKKHHGWNPFSKDNVKTAPLRNNSCDDFAKTSERKVISSSPHTSTTWLISTCIFVSGSLLNFTSYAFAAQSMLASLESMQFVTNLMFGKFMLGANVTRTMLIGTCLTVIGTLIFYRVEQLPPLV